MTAEEYNLCVNKHADNVYRFILKSVRDNEKAKDIVQDSFEKLWLKIKEVSFDKSKSYLFSIAYHTMVDQIRRDKRVGTMDEVNPAAISHSDHYSDLNEHLHRAVEQLPEIQKNVILLRDYEGYSYEEIGEITGLNESQVKVYIYRARIFLKSYIGSLEAVI